MKKISILAYIIMLLAISCNAFSNTINVSGTYTESRSGEISDDYDFQNNGSARLEFGNTSDVILMGQLLNSTSSAFIVHGSIDSLTIANNQSNIVFNIFDTTSNGSSANLFKVNNTDVTTDMSIGNWGLYQATGRSDWHFQFASPVIIDHHSFAGILVGPNSTSHRYGYIGSDSKSASLKYKTSQGHSIGYLHFLHGESEFILSNENASEDVTYTLPINFGGNKVAALENPPIVPTLTPTDNSGIISLHSQTHALNVSGPGKMGTDATHRLMGLNLTGDSAINISTPTFAKNISLNSSADITFANSLNMGAGGTINLSQDTNLVFSNPATFTAISPTIYLGDKTLTIGGGTATFSGDEVVLNVTLTNDNTKIGKIVVDNGGSVDISSASNVALNFTADTSDENLIEENEAEYSFKIFEDLAESNPAIDNIIDSNNITLNATESNPLVSWEYNPTTHILSSVTNLNALEEVLNEEGKEGDKEGGKEEPKEEVKEEVKEVVSASPNVVQFVAAVTEAAKADEPNTKAIAFLQSIGQGASDIKEIITTLETIKPENTIEDSGALEASEAISGRIGSLVQVSVSVDNSSSPTISTPAGTGSIGSSSGTATSQSTTGSNSVSSGTATNQSTTGSNSVSSGGSESSSNNNNSSNSSGDSSQSSEGDNAQALGAMLGAGIAAGDDIASKYGVWFSPFYQRATQKKVKANSGYNVINYGGAFGVDCKASDIISLGIVWSNVKSNLRQKDDKLGSKSLTNSNIFSIYAAAELPKNFNISGIASYGISTIRNSDRRPLTQKTYQLAKSKYKSRFYSLQADLAKTIMLKNQYIVTPSIGVKYSESHDDGFKETGTFFQNYGLSKKRYSQIDGIIGAKISYNTSFEDFKLVPFISGTAYINLKDNPATTYMTSDLFSNILRIKGDKKDEKAWYAISAGADFTKENMEYGIAYENQLDKKYVGHQIKGKVKVNF